MVATDLRQLSTYDVINLWAATATELKRRNILRTNNVIGDLAEAIGHEHLGGTRAGFSEKGWDVLTPDGEYVQIKGLWRTSSRRTKISAIRGDKYDTLLVIVFTPTFELEGAYQTTKSVVEQKFARSSHVNGRQPTITQRFINASSRQHFPSMTCD
ncbi:hypothetical protein MycrhDRAFT_5665 [Mycolicibacterium rhodesiae JS60]|nr:hypothetical protein MycrhDRAFT_5665 [Mycolicibacterium rhodesiae JS60]